MATKLRGIGWDHPRCIGPMQACADEWQRDRGVEVAWVWRSLEAFGDQPLEDLAADYDLLVIDHPFCGTAAATEALVPLDDLLPAATLTALAADAIGPSHVSYSFAGRQWGLATDAACQVMAVREDLLPGKVPDTWDGVVELSRSRAGRVALPLAPAHSISSFLSLCANRGAALAEGASLVEDETGTAALALLAALYDAGPPEMVQWEPPEALDHLTSGDELDCLALTYGYVTYARESEVEAPCRFVDMPSAGHGPIGSVLGGAGLAVSSASKDQEAAAAFAAWASSASTQRRLVAPSGGQPGSRSAWLDPALDAASGGFYSGTLATITKAWVRPRDAWWPSFQLQAGRALTASLARRAPAAATLAALQALFHDCRGRTA